MDEHGFGKRLSKVQGKGIPCWYCHLPKDRAAIATGKKRILTCDATFENNVMGLVPTELVEPRFLYYWSLTF